MTVVQTVLGAIDSAQLGTVLSHEHVVQVLGEDNHHYPWMFDWEQTRAIAIRELSEAKANGVDTLIDLTTPDLGRDVGFVRDVAAAEPVTFDLVGPPVGAAGHHPGAARSRYRAILRPAA